MDSQAKLAERERGRGNLALVLYLCPDKNLFCTKFDPQPQKVAVPWEKEILTQFSIRFT